MLRHEINITKYDPVYINNHKDTPYRATASVSRESRIYIQILADCSVLYKYIVIYNYTQGNPFKFLYNV